MKRTPLRRQGIIRGKPIRVRGVKDDAAKWTRIRLAVHGRDQAACLACGVHVKQDNFECHHRKLRSQGGPDEPTNLITLCHGCHDHAHRNRAWANGRGLILRPWQDPAVEPVELVDGRRILLTADLEQAELRHAH